MSVWDSRSILGRSIRLPLRCLPPSTVVPILTGSSRGMRWIVGSAPHGAWLGTLERRKLGHFVGRLRDGMTVWDIGAHVGLYTLASARAVGPAGQVHAFEPVPENLRFLKRRLGLNRLTNVKVWDAAVGDRSGSVRMAPGDSPSEYHVEPTGPAEVPAITLDDWWARSGSAPPHLVKIDVEGSEVAVLRGGSWTLGQHRPPIYLALHGDHQRVECGRLLAQWGWRVVSLVPGRAPETSSEWLAEAA